MSAASGSKPKKKPSKLDRLLARIRRYPSESRLMVQRNVAFGAAATSFLVFLQVIQVGAKTTELEISVTAAAIAFPIWIALGSMYEMFVSLGKRSYPYLLRPGVNEAFANVAGIAGIALLVSIGAAMSYLAENALIAFVVASLVAMIITMIFALDMARWWYGADGPGDRDEKDH